MFLPHTDLTDENRLIYSADAAGFGNTDWHNLWRYVEIRVFKNPQRLLEEARRSAESRVPIAVGER